MARKKHRSQLDAIDEINMTPLIDLTFLLLIIFMITAPLLEYAVDLSPPEMNAGEISDNEKITLNINKNGKLLINSEHVNIKTLPQELLSRFQGSRNIEIFIRADGSRPYREIINLMKVVESTGFSNISLVTAGEK